MSRVRRPIKTLDCVLLKIKRLAFSAGLGSECPRVYMTTCGVAPAGIPVVLHALQFSTVGYYVCTRHIIEKCSPSASRRVASNTHGKWQSCQIKKTLLQMSLQSTAVVWNFIQRGEYLTSLKEKYLESQAVWAFVLLMMMMMIIKIIYKFFSSSATTDVYTQQYRLYFVFFQLLRFGSELSKLGQ